MNDIGILNEALNSNYVSFNEVYGLADALKVCLENEKLYRYVRYFNSDTWIYDNQEKLASILEEYYKHGGYNPDGLKQVTNSHLLTVAYKTGHELFFYGKATNEALNEENIRLAFDSNHYDSFLFRDSSLVLTVYLKYDYNLNIQFRDICWNDENAKLYIEKITNGSSKNKIPSFYSSKVALKEVINVHQFNLINDFYFSNIKLDDEIGELLYERMVEYPDLIVPLKFYMLKGIESYYLKGLLISKRFDLVESALSLETLNDENFEFLADGLEDYLKINNKLSYLLIKNEVILHKLIELKRFDIIDTLHGYLDSWTYENIRFYFDSISNLDNERFFENNPLALKAYCEGDYSFKVLFSKECWNDENINLYFSKLRREKPKELIRTFVYIPNYFSLSLKNNVFGYLKYYYDSYKESDIDLLCSKIREFPDEKFNFSGLLLRDNMDLVSTLIETKKFSIISENDNLISMDDECFLRFSEVMEEYISLGFNLPWCCKNSSVILRKMIEINRFDGLHSFKNNTWDKNNISLIINKLVTNDELYFNNISCRSDNYFIYAVRNLNVNLPRNSVYTGGSYDYKKYNDSFFRYLEDNKIPDINYLIKYYSDMNILSEYIDNNGFITDKFKEELIFDHSYQCYCRDNNIDITSGIDNQIILTYLKYSYLVPELYRGILINNINVSMYFDEVGPKNRLYDDMFNYHSLGSLKSLLSVCPNNNFDELKLYCINKLLQIDNDKIRKLCFNYISCNFSNLNKKKVNDLLVIVSRIEYSNSLEIRQFSEQIVMSVLNYDNPYEKLDRIENVFLRNNIPMFAKVFLCFKILYPNFEKKDNYGNKVFNFGEYSRMSPELLEAGPNNDRMKLYKKLVHEDKTQIRFQILFNDLLRISVESNSRTLVNYISCLKKGDELVSKLSNHECRFEQLNDDDLNVLSDFFTYLEVIDENINDEKIDFKSMNINDKYSYFVNQFKPTNKYSLGDRVVRYFCYFAGVDSLSDLENWMKYSYQTSSQINDSVGHYLECNNLVLEDNDLLRCMGKFDSLGGSLENGNVCKELLGTFIGKSDSDTTPLDIDFTLVKKMDNLYDSINGTPTGWGFGNLFFVVKGIDDRINITRDKDGNRLDVMYDPKKTEFFGTSTKLGGFEMHWGARSGISLSNIHCFIYKELVSIDSSKPYNEDGTVNYIGASSFDDLPYIKFEIAKHGLYIPIVDLTGKLIFTKKEYEKIRYKMMGLSYYNCDKYYIDVDSLMFDDIDEIMSEMEHDRSVVSKKREIIYNLIRNIVISDELGLDTVMVNDSLTGNISSGIVELLETGSTARFSNVPGDSDFDFMLKLDRKYILDKEIVNKIISKFRSVFNPQEEVPGKENRFRGAGIKLSDTNDLVDIDISLDQKRNSDYSSEMALNDRYQSIKKQYPKAYSFVLANIVKAKKLLKLVNAYKPLEGGMGGIGIENWILQNGGSLKCAALDFIKHAYNEDGSLKSFSDFKKCYQIWDFGCNHEPKEIMKNVYYPYDNYVNKMNEDSYKKMVETLKNYLNNYKKNTIKTVSY